jgi:hypothetical protein
MNLNKTVETTDGHGWARIIVGGARHSVRAVRELACDGAHRRQRFGLRWQSVAATPLSIRLITFQSGVALCFPPQSKIRGCGASRVGFIRVHPWLLLFLLVLFAPVVRAQNAPHIGYVYPAGGRHGATFLVTVGGQFPSGITNFAVVMDGDLAPAKVVAYDRPLKPKEQQALKEELDKFQEKRKGGERLTGADLARLDEIKRLLTQFGRQPANPAISEFMTLQLTLATNVAPGDHEIRVRTPGGLSNPLKFCVGLLPETTKTDWKAVPKERGSMDPAMPLPTEVTVKLPVTINGQILPGGADRYHFWARQGQQLVLAVEARQLIPYLADAVPGWFEAVLTVYDSKGREMASEERFRFKPDPVIHFEVPSNGTYTVEIRDSLYRGREDFVYRLTMGELPFVTGIFPLGGKAGEKTSVALTGWNLPETSLECDNAETGITSLNGKFFNAVPFATDDLPECLEQEPNDSQETAQPVTLPAIVNGRIDYPGDWDVFRFEGRAGDPVVAEVYARRLDSPLDSVIKLTDAAGKQLAFNDDYEDKGSGLNTHHADSYFSTVLPTNGTYYVWLGDAQHKGGPEYSYRLRLSPPQPDFALRVVPSSINVRPGASAPLTIYALRKDGFNDEITLVLDGAPNGFKLGGDSIPSGQNQVQITLTAPPTASNELVGLNLEGCTMIQGRALLRKAVPAEDMMQAFAYRHLVPVNELEVNVFGRGTPRAALTILSGSPVRISPGGSARIQVGLPGPRVAERAQFELSNPPEGITIGSVSQIRGGVEIVLQTDAAKVKPGLKGNLIINGYVPRPAETNAAKTKANNNQRLPLGAVPAVPFEIIPP